MVGYAVRGSGALSRDRAVMMCASLRRYHVTTLTDEDWSRSSSHKTIHDSIHGSIHDSIRTRFAILTRRTSTVGRDFLAPIVSVVVFYIFDRS